MIVIDIRELEYRGQELIEYLDNTIKSIKGPRKYAYDWPDVIIASKKQHTPELSLAITKHEPKIKIIWRS